MAEKTKSRLTFKQLEAVEASAPNVVVLAGAGSGKTSVLVQRYLHTVLHGKVTPARILTATFTEKAAAEMKARILRQLLVEEKSELSAQVSAAPICTLHSFCSRLISSRALKLGLDPRFRIIEEHEADLLQEEVLSEVMDRWRKGERAGGLRNLSTRLHWSGDHGLRPGRTPGSRGFSRQFLNLMTSVRCAGPRDGEIFKPLDVDTERIASAAGDYLVRIEEFQRRVAPGPSAKSAEKAEGAKRFLAGYLRLSDKRSQQALEVAENLAKISLQVSTELKAILKPIREELCPQMQDLCRERGYESVRSVLNALAEAFIAAYSSRKLDRGVLDFLDLEEKALEILLQPDQDIPIDMILIDEAQDLNPVQWEIIRHLRRRATLFAVGDGQQSIYGFRDADVGLFFDLAREAGGGGGKVISLDENFRSRSAILAIVNRSFERIFPEENGISFLRLAAKYPYPDGLNDTAELLLSAAPDRRKAREVEAQFLAKRLSELIEEDQFRVHRETGRDSDGSSILVAERPNWRDILILVRASTSFAPLERALQANSIPCVLQAGRGFWDALEISDLLALLRSLEDPGDDFSLACLLRSPAVGFGDDDLVALRFVSKGGTDSPPEMQVRPLYEGLFDIASKGGEEESLAWRAEKFLALFHRLYRLKDRIPLRRLIEIWIHETGLESFWEQERQGQLMEANVRKFLRLCDVQAGQSAARLRAAFEEMRLRDLQESSAPAAAAEGGAVRIMTVHAAKGLEAPIVAIFDMNYQPRGGGVDFAFSREHGAAFALAPDEFGGKPYRPRIFDRIVEDRKEHMGDEEARVLYVAMTRAREKLILSASCSQREDRRVRSGGWLRLLQDRKLLPDLETLLNPATIPQNEILIPDKEGVMTALQLRRCGADIELGSVRTPTVKVEPEAPPSGFPATPRNICESLSVTEFLHRQGSYPKEFTTEPKNELARARSLAGGASLGSLAHRVIQVVLQDGIGDDLEDVARVEALKLFHEPPAPEFIHQAAKICLNFLDSDLASEAREAKMLLTEYSILFDYNGILFKAKLDLAYGDESTWALVDFKSGPPPAPELLTAYHQQMQIYALGWRALTGALPSHALIFWLDSGVAMEVSLSEAALKSVEKLLSSPLST